MKKFLVSTADCYGYDADDNLLFVGKTLLDTSIETTLSNTDVRAGRGNQLQYIYYHTAEMNITVNEAQFSLEFLSLNTGSAITTGGDVFVEESVTLANGQGTVTKQPLALSGSTLYGWVTFADGKVERVTFTGQAFTVTNASSNETVCVRYYTNVSSARSITINADMLPSTIRLVMEAQLCSSEATTNKIGTVQIQVPKASMTGQFTLSMTPDSVAQTPLTVRALASTVNDGGCSGNKSIYATITEILDSVNWYDDVVALAIEGGDLTMTKGDTKTLRVFAVPSTGAAFLAPTNDITVSTSDQSKVSVSGNTITAAAATGSTPAIIGATITAKPSIDANIQVTVSGE
nr:MAG TPA: structural protein [Caudoviricetes sp.]